MNKGLHATLDGRVVSVLSVEKQSELDTYAKVSFSIPADEFLVTELRGKDFAIYANNTLFAKGTILTRPSLAIEDGKNVIDISGVTELGKLTCDRAYSLAYYQDTLIVAILNDLLATATTTFVLDATGFADAGTATTTIDLRSKESLFSQLAEVVKAYPNLHIRESLDGLGNTVIELGEFDELLHQASKETNILSISLQEDSTRAYSAVEAYGGLSPSVRVSLNDTIVDGRALALPYYSDYPITVDGNGLAFITAIASTANCSTTKTFDFHKTNNEEAVTQADIDDASLALYQKAVRFLQSVSDHEDFDMSLVTSFEELQVGDRVYVSCDVYEEVLNEASLSFERIKILSVSDSFRITNVNTKLDEYHEAEGELYVYDIRVTNGEDTANYDSEVELYERLEKPNDVPSLDALQVSTPVVLEITHDEATDPTDCNVSGDGKLFTFDVATGAPDFATGKQVLVTQIQPSGVSFDTVQNNTNDLTDVIYCVRAPAPDENWGTGADTVTLSVLVIYT